MTDQNFEETRAVGRLANLDIEIVHRRARDDSAELLSVSLSAVPSFAAVSRTLEAANPLLFWARLWQAAWSPWLALAPPGEPHDRR